MGWLAYVTIAEERSGFLTVALDVRELSWILSQQPLMGCLITLSKWQLGQIVNHLRPVYRFQLWLF